MGPMGIVRNVASRFSREQATFLASRLSQAGKSSRVEFFCGALFDSWPQGSISAGLAHAQAGNLAGIILDGLVQDLLDQPA